MPRPRLALLPLALLLLGGCAFTHDVAARGGAADARREIRAGTLALETYGFGRHPSSFGAGKPAAYFTYFTGRGVEIRAVQCCALDEWIIGHADGFNRVMKEEIRKKLGPDIFELAEAQARPQ